MKPAELNLTIYQGATFIKPFQWKSGTPETPVVITGFTGKMHIRKKIKDEVIVLELTTANAKIVITDGVLGKFEIRLTGAETAALASGSYVYDLELIHGSGEPVYRLFGGTITVVGEVTR